MRVVYIVCLYYILLYYFSIVCVSRVRDNTTLCCSSEYVQLRSEEQSCGDQERQKMRMSRGRREGGSRIACGLGVEQELRLYGL